MYFISLVKFKKKLTKAVVAENLGWVEENKKAGIKFHGLYWTLGKYDAVALFEAPNEKEAMKMAIKRGENLSLETLVAIPLEEAKKLIE